MFESGSEFECKCVNKSTVTLILTLLLLSRQVFPIRLRCTQTIGTTRFAPSFSPFQNKKAACAAFVVPSGLEPELF